MLKLEGVRSGYRRRPVLLGVDLAVEDGQSVALLGRNGVGKTTLLKTIVGALPMSAGTLQLDGSDLSRLRTSRRARSGIAYVPQGREVFAGLSVADNLRVAAQAIFGRGWREHVERTLDEFGALADKRSAPAESLSGGQQQILALARAMICQPRILLLDEPSEGIQPSILEQISALIADVRTQRGVAVLIAEQNLGFAAGVADQAVVLERGRVAERLPVAEIESSAELQRRYLAV
jgi:ABC-type branched-subunit amino acid transport system ATPase component